MNWPTIHVTTVQGWSAERDDNVARLVEDYQGEVCQHDDPDRRGLLWNHRNALLCATANPEPWSLTASDDVYLLDGFHDQIERALESAPSPAVSLSHFSSYGERLAKRGIPWGMGTNSMWGLLQAFRSDFLAEYLPTVEDFLTLSDLGFPQVKKWDDGVVQAHHLMYGTTTAFASRALAQHADFRSIYGHVPGRWRHAQSTIETRTEEQVPWDGGARPATLPIHPEVRRMVGVLQQWRAQEKLRKDSARAGD